jgi:YHS domain-containing protein
MLTHQQIDEWDFTEETTVCQHCAQVHIAGTSVAKTVWEGDEEVTYFFCSSKCSFDFYLNRLRNEL